MASPAKKRKLNNDPKSKATPSRTLDHFFGKKNSGPSSRIDDSPVVAAENSEVTTSLTDEQLARKLQAEWDRESSGASTARNGESKEENDRISPKPEGEAIDEAQLLSKQSGQAIADLDGTVATHSVAEPDKAIPQTENTLTLQAAGTAEDTLSSNIPFDQSPLTFDPSKYVQELQGHWAADGGNASYALLTRCFVLVNSTQSRIKIVDTLVNMLRVIIEADPDSLLPTVWLATNSISPPYISLELGLGGSAISKALKNVCGLDSKSLKALYDKVGDAGDVAFEAKKKQSFTLRKPKPLTIKGVYQSLVKIANTQGTGSGEVKQRIVDRLLQDARGAEESRYVVRTLCQHVSSCYHILKEKLIMLASDRCCKDHNVDCIIARISAVKASWCRHSIKIPSTALYSKEGSVGRGVGKTRGNCQSVLCKEAQLQ
jgi:DNA ligase-1